VNFGWCVLLAFQERISTRKQFMIIFLTIIHVIVSVFMIAVILLQQGKSADLAGAFGGQGSQTAFGPRGAANLLTRMTTWSAIIFTVTSISLFVLIGKHAGGGSVLEGTPTAPTHQQAPAHPAPKK
jgi:preprotein translocase subunit SecG